MKSRWQKGIRLFLFATIFALLFRFLVLEDFRVASDSMVPTLLPGDLVFVSKSAFQLRLPFSSYAIASFRAPKRGSVVAFSLPESQWETYTKRVVATEGDTVAIQQGVLLVNDIPAEYLAQNSVSGVVTEKTVWASYPILRQSDKVKDYGPVTIPQGHFFALGDNRTDSIDSRVWGPIPYRCLKGSVFMVWLSLDPHGLLRSRRFGLWVR